MANGMPPAFVHVIEAQQRQLTPTAWVTGHIVSQNDARLSVEVSGRIQQLLEIGSQVKQGDVIAQLDANPWQIAHDEAKANLTKAESRLEFLEAEVKRKADLSKRNLSTQTDYEETRSQRDVAIGELAESKARLARSKQNLDFTKLKAPFNGLVVERMASLGEYVSSGSAIIRLVDNDKLEAAVFAPIAAFQFVQVGDEVAVKSQLGSAMVKVKSIVPATERQSQLMEIRLDTSQLNWPVGLNIKAAIPTAASITALSVPRDALVLRRNMTQVFRVNADNQSEMVPVTVGVAAAQWIQVQGDLKAGDKIIVRGAERLRPGQAVMIKPSNDNLISGQQ